MTYETALEVAESNIAGYTHDAGLKGSADFLATVRRRATRIIRKAPQSYYDILALLERLQAMNANPNYLQHQTQFAIEKNLSEEDVTHNGISRTIRNAIAGSPLLYAGRGVIADQFGRVLSLTDGIMAPSLDQST